MKNQIVFLAILMIASQAFAQKKSKKADPKDTQITMLTQQLDSVSKALTKYRGVYDTLKVKVVHYNFDPTRTSFLIDSILIPKDSLHRLQLGKSHDTISMLMREINTLKASIDSTNSAAVRNKAAMLQAEVDRAKTITELKQLKELLDAKIISEGEYSDIKRKYILKL
jgi:hypothetical protein